MGIIQSLTRRKKVYLLLCIIGLILSIVFFALFINTVPSLSNGRITLDEFNRQWWVFSVLAILSFSPSVFFFVKCFSNKSKKIILGIAISLVVLSIGLWFISGHIVNKRLIEYHIPSKTGNSIQLLHVAAIIVSGIIIGYCAALRSNNHVDKKCSDKGDGTIKPDTISKNSKYTYLEEYKAKMKEEQP